MIRQLKWKPMSPVLSKRITQKQLIIVLIWLLFTLIAFGYFISERLVVFDSTDKLENISHQSLSSSFKQYVSTEKTTTLIHFSNLKCSCQKYSKQHVEELNQLALAQHFNVVDINIEQHAKIPSIPSVALLNRSGELVYFGPYGQGIDCSQTAGFATTVLKNFIKGFSANVIIKKTKGCYCNIPS